MWPGITYETCAWERDPDDLALVPKSRRRKILPTYEAAVPASIAALPVEIQAVGVHPADAHSLIHGLPLPA